MFTTPSACIHFRSGKYFNFRSVFAQALHRVCLCFFAIKYFLSNWHKIQLWHKFSLVIFIWLMPVSQLYLGLTLFALFWWRISLGWQLKDFPGVTNFPDNCCYWLRRGKNASLIVLKFSLVVGIRDMKIPKILLSKSRRFRFYGKS